MRVLKFGGTSVGSAERMRDVANIINDGNRNVVVLSAMSGTTNKLVEICGLLSENNKTAATQAIDKMESDYVDVVTSLFEGDEYQLMGNELVRVHFEFIRSFTQDMFTVFEERAVLAQGELLSTALFHFYLRQVGVRSVLLPALDFMKLDLENEPDKAYIKRHLTVELSKVPEIKIFITQGFICRNQYGEIDNLKRGGSDYTASLIGEAIEAEEIQIWTDIDGMHNNDPRIVDNTKPISRLLFDEAAELAYFGAKILHPSSVRPAAEGGVPVRLKNTMDPAAEGTLISGESEGTGFKAIAAKDGITAIKIKSGRMLLAHGFLRKVFEVFESYKTSIDMITTSEVAVSLTIDDPTNLEAIVEELSKYGRVEVDDKFSIVCIVGNFVEESKGHASKVFEGLKDIPIRMISYGGSKYNISLLIKEDHKKDALRSLHKHLDL